MSQPNHPQPELPPSTTACIWDLPEDSMAAVSLPPPNSLKPGSLLYNATYAPSREAVLQDLSFEDFDAQPSSSAAPESAAKAAIKVSDGKTSVSIGRALPDHFK